MSWEALSLVPSPRPSLLLRKNTGHGNYSPYKPKQSLTDLKTKLCDLTLFGIARRNLKPHKHTLSPNWVKPAVPEFQTTALTPWTGSAIEDTCSPPDLEGGPLCSANPLLADALKGPDGFYRKMEPVLCRRMELYIIHHPIKTSGYLE